MPIYEYSCPFCSFRFERIRSRPTPAETCPQCGKEAPRIISLTAPGGSGSGSCPSSHGFG